MKNSSVESGFPLILIADNDRLTELQDAEILPRRWLAQAPPGEGVCFTSISVESLKERLGDPEGSRAWCAARFLDDARPRVVWLQFVDDAGGEKAAKQRMIELRGELEQLLKEAIGYRQDSLQHAGILIDPKPDKQDRDKANIRRLHEEPKLPFGGYYMGPILNPHEDRALSSDQAWPISVSLLLGWLHLSEGFKQAPAAEWRAWRSIGYRGWSEEDGHRVAAKAAKLALKALDKGFDSGLSSKLRKQLSPSHDVPTPMVPPVKAFKVRSIKEFDTSAALAEYERSDPAEPYAVTARSSRQEAVPAEKLDLDELQGTLWGFVHETPRAPHHLLSRPELVAEGEAVGEMKDLHAALGDLAKRAQSLEKDRTDVKECGEHVRKARDGRLGPALRLIVAVAVSALMAYSIFNIFDLLLGMRSLAIFLVGVVAASTLGTAGVMWLLERRTCDRAIKDFYINGLGAICDKRSNLLHERARLLAKACKRRAANRFTSARLELRERLERLRHIIDRHLFSVRTEIGYAPAILEERLVEARQAFIVTLEQGGVAKLEEDDLNDLRGKLKADATDRWKEFCLQDDRCLGRLSSQELVAVLEKTNALREREIHRRLRQGLGVCERLEKEWRAREEERFSFGLSVRQQRQKIEGSFFHLHVEDPGASAPGDSQSAPGLVDMKLVGLYHETHPVETGEGEA
jgi:hypothetical protein